MKRNFSLILFLLAGLLVNAQSTSSWKNLFNGKDLTGWKRLAGLAEYTVEDGVIVGRTVMNTGNTFLVTEKEYGDFILELDLFVEDEEGNSGIQTRSHFDATANKGIGKVYGRQCEADPGEYFKKLSCGFVDYFRFGKLFEHAKRCVRDHFAGLLWRRGKHVRRLSGRLFQL